MFLMRTHGGSFPTLLRLQISFLTVCVCSVNIICQSVQCWACVLWDCQSRSGFCHVAPLQPLFEAPHCSLGFLMWSVYNCMIISEVELQEKVWSPASVGRWSTFWRRLSAIETGNFNDIIIICTSPPWILAPAPAHPYLLADKSRLKCGPSSAFLHFSASNIVLFRVGVLSQDFIYSSDERFKFNEFL